MIFYNAHASLSIDELNREIYISANGISKLADGSRNRPFKSIQPALDISRDGDVLIVLEGLYTGPENRNLNFKGKSIVLQSEFPDDNTCLNNTIIDAEGIGYVIRFINDEDSRSSFQGFSIVPGDTSLIPLKGIPGFIELSTTANPTTRRLKILSATPKKPVKVLTRKAANVLITADQQIFKFDPFVQPFNITDYYGSGDVNKDGSLNNSDLVQLDSIIAGLIPPNIRADTDGNGKINAEDKDLLDSAIFHDITLSAWWNQLTTEEEKNRWIDRILEVDKTDELLYVDNVFVCWGFAEQIRYRAVQRISDNTTDPAYTYPDAFRSSVIDGGQTIYNLPIYYTSIAGASIGHGINAVLTGNDPFQFDHWRFFEPQTDYGVSPGMWDMPYNSQVIIRDQFSVQNRIVFYVDETQTILDTFINDDPRPYYYAFINPVNNCDFQYNPKLLENHPDYILYEKQRDDMTRITDIFLSDLKGFEKPLTHLNHYSRLWDIKKLENDQYVLLWSSKTDQNLQTIYTGTLDMNSLKLKDVETITSNTDGYLWCDLELIIDSSLNKHVFLYVKRGVSNNEVSQLRYFNNISGVWSTNDLVTNPQVGFLEHINTFNVVQYGNEILVFCLADIDLEQSSTISSILMLRFDGTWHEQIVLENYPLTRISADVDPSGRIHIVYADLSLSASNFYHFYSDDSYTWSLPEKIVSTVKRPYARDLRLFHNVKGELYLTYEARYGNRFVPVWQKYSGGVWHEPNLIEIPEDESAAYTDACVSSQNILQMVWAAQSLDSLKIVRYFKCLDDQTITIYETISICEGDSILLGGESQTMSGTYYDTLSSIYGCDSVIITDLIVYPAYQEYVTEEICEGDSILIGGELQTISGTYFDTLSSIHGCDSVIITDLIVYPAYQEYVTEEICKGDSILLGGELQTISGTYFDTLSSIHGCDSVIITDLIINDLPRIYLGGDTSIYTNDTIILDAGNGYIEYYWNNNSIKQTIIVYSLTAGDHEFSVKVKDVNNCVGSDTLVIHAILPNSLSTASSYFDIEVLPNPTSDFIVIRSNIYIETKCLISLFDHSGKKIIERKIEGTTHRLDLSTFQKGVYFITIRSKDFVITRKIIKL